MALFVFNRSSMKILITGVAGFIGMHTAKRLLRQGVEVVGVDIINDYYDPQLKVDRLAELRFFEKFVFCKVDIFDLNALELVFSNGNFSHVIHLAAQAGVRHSIENPHSYSRNNLVGFLNVLECCRQRKILHFIYASSSSVYGGNLKQPFSESDSVDCPVSLYAATKKANELMAYSYSHLYALPTTGLRFFTVYGPWGRPDMAYYIFTKAIIENKSIDVFNNGYMKRDFTYIDDIVEGVELVLTKPPGICENFVTPARVFNVGNHTPVPLLDFISLIEQSLGKKAVKRFLPMQSGDVLATYADVEALHKWVGFMPTTPLAVGVEKFTLWYRSYYK